MALTNRPLDGKDLTLANTADWRLKLGATATDDPRLSDARAPRAHTHVLTDVTGLAAALAGKAALSHTHNTVTLVEVDFGPADGATTASAHVNAPAVTAAHTLLCLPSGRDTDDHSADETLLESVRAIASPAAGSFHIMAHAPEGTWGRHSIAVQSTLSA